MPPNIKVQGLRGPIPSGYLVGRTDPGTGEAQLIAVSDLSRQIIASGGGSSAGAARDAIVFDLGEGATVTAGVALYHLRVPYRFRIVNVKAEVEAPTTAGDITVDINYGPASLLTTKITIPAGGRTSMELAVQPVWSPLIMGDDGILEIDVDNAGDGTATGLKVQIIGYYTTSVLTATGVITSLLGGVSQAALGTIIKVKGTISSVLGEITQAAEGNIVHVSGTISSILGEITQDAAGDVQTPTVGHRYWRFRPTAKFGGANCVIGDMELRESLTGNNILPSATGVTMLNELSGLTAVKAYDGLAGTNSTGGGTVTGVENNFGWTGDPASTTSWIRWDFGGSFSPDVKVVRLYAVEDVDAGTLMPKSWVLEYSDDDSTWVGAKTVTNDSAYVGFQLRHFYVGAYSPSYSGSPWGTHEYWRIMCYDGGAFGVFAFCEADFRATPGGSDQASGGTAFATSNFGVGFTPDLAFDNLTATLWASSTRQKQTVIGYHFASAVSVGQIFIQARVDAAPEQAPTDGWVQYSDNGTDYKTAFSFKNASAWSTGGGQITFDDPLYV